MNNISQISIFDYREIENLGDLERLKIFFENIEDDKLCETLEKERKNGRNDYPVRTMLNLIYAMKIFGHRSIESFRRELSRNSQLRIACGLSEGKYKYCGERKHLVPPARVFTGFLNKLKKHEKEIEEIKEKDIKFMYENLEGFGEDCAVDGKYLDTYANQFHKSKAKKENDKRAEHEATSSCKTYYMKDGSRKNEWHYGFRAHIICDAKYGLPIKSKVTPANNSEQTELDNMLKEMDKDEEKYKLEKMQNLMGDAGYESGVRNKKLKEEYNINAIIDLKHIWDKEEKYKEIENQMIAYNEEGEVFLIIDIEKQEYEKLKYLGYDKENEALRYGRYTKGKKIYRVPLSTDYRIFVPVARDSKKFKKKYKMRTEIERLNGRIDRDYMFNDHFIRGKEKMELMLNLTFIVMLTIAKGHIKNKQKNIRSLVA
ncbi:transposase [uncultured Muribaculum sp.]|uniref:transposase n=1 Tax=uncultured Muribaculum sp. TaxID=1918613 RepID=UPI00272F1A61|nr:transposase [uncultured Muribaculum sp.]